MRKPAVAVISTSLLAAALLIFALRPAGRPSAQAAARAATGGRVLAVRSWGKGAVVLASRADRTTVGYAVDRGRGWLLVSSSTRRALTTDVEVGSLLVASSKGGRGQPAWSAVYGQLRDPRIQKIEITWRGAQPPSVGRREGDAYLIVRPLGPRPLKARYLASDGAEVATVPIG